MTDWPALLDAIDEGLRSSPPVLVDFSPAAIGPLPVALAPRATATLARMREAAAMLEAHRADIGRELSALAAAKPSMAASSSSPVPHFLDTKA